MQSAIWCHCVAITVRLQATAEDVTLQPFIWCLTELCDTIAFNFLLSSALKVFFWLHSTLIIYIYTTTTTAFTALFPGPPRWANARRKILLDFVVLGRITTGRHTDSPRRRHSIRTNQQSTSTNPPNFYAGCPSCRNTPNLSWLGTVTGICWIAHPIAWLIVYVYNNSNNNESFCFNDEDRDL